MDTRKQTVVSMSSIDITVVKNGESSGRLQVVQIDSLVSVNVGDPPMFINVHLKRVASYKCSKLTPLL